MVNISLYDILPHPLSEVIEVVVNSIENGENGIKQLENILLKRNLGLKKSFRGRRPIIKYIEAVIKFLRGMGWKINRYNHHFEIHKKVEQFTVWNIKEKDFVIISDTHYPNTYQKALEEAMKERMNIIHLGDLGEIQNSYFSYIIYGNHDIKKALDERVIGRMIGGLIVDGKYLILGIHDNTFTFINYPKLSTPPRISIEGEFETLLFVSHSHRGFFDNKIPPTKFFEINGNIIILPVGTLSTLKSDRSKYHITIDYNILRIGKDNILIEKKYFGSIYKRGEIIGKRMKYLIKIFNY